MKVDLHCPVAHRGYTGWRIHTEPFQPDQNIVVDGEPLLIMIADQAHARRKESV